MNHPAVVALVPTHDGARHLGETLASLAAQDYPRLTVVVSDDASTDDTRAVYADVARDCSRFRLLCQPKRAGWVDNSNLLLAEVDGDYAFFAPQDDIFEPTYVSRLVAALQARADAVLAFADTAAVGDEASFRPLAREAREGGRVRRALRYIPDDGYERCLPFRGLVRVAALRTVGPLRRSMLGEFDADGRWLFRLALLGPFVRVPERLCAKRIHAASLAASWNYSSSTWRSTRCAM